MKYTQNHHLPQWAASDRIRMDDFNKMNQSIEAGLDEAKAIAERALAKANAAFSTDNLPFTVGSYVGTGDGQLVRLGFKPSFLIISGMKSSADPDDLTTFDRYFGIAGHPGGLTGGQLQFRIQLTDDGFFTFRSGLSGMYLPILDEKDRKYYYIAFR